MMHQLSTLTLVLLALLCLAGSAFFSASETALTMLNRYRVRSMAEKGHRGARLAHRLIQQPDRTIGLILILNNFFNIAFSMIGTVLTIRYYGESALGFAAIVVTIITLLGSEITPKTLGALHPERVAFPVSFILSPLAWCMTPVIWATNLMARSMLTVLGLLKEQGRHQSLSTEELRTVVMEANMVASSAHTSMLLNILDLERLTVADAMVHRQDIEALDIKWPWPDIENVLMRSNKTHLPVYAGTMDQMLGVIRLREVLQVWLEGDMDRDELTALLHAPYYIPESTPLHFQAQRFKERREHFALVVDEYGSITGLLTLEDILEEIMGELPGHREEGAAEIIPQGDGSFLVNALLPIRTLNRLGGWALPEEGPSTINGLMQETLEAIPEPGMAIETGGYRIEAIKADDQAVRIARLIPSASIKPGTSSA
jgi:Mg2+/Co2+ transporter CorB